MASIELQGCARQAAGAINSLRQCVEQMGRAVRGYNVHGLSAELAALEADGAVVGEIDKERMQETIALGASILFYLTGEASGANTILGTPPMSAPQMLTALEKLSVYSS